jgi:predicted nucleic acid-binding protein
VDTDVAAAAVLGESTSGEEAARLLGGKWDFAAPSHWKAEFANVLWKAVQFGRIDPEEIDAILNRAGALPIESVDVAELWRGAVARAIAASHPPYDILFVELAIRLGTRVASFDGRLQRKFPSTVKHPGDLLRS